MPTYKAKVDGDRMVRLPAELCRRLRIKDGSEVEFFLTTDGYVHFHAITGKLSEFGIQVRRPAISIREMDDAISDHISAEDARIMASAYKRIHKSAAE
jgi:bifunctional DNA-binding transcriptional regulator/antitoxin component of YhaV-PrlF toxin-antitoxin module